MSALALEIDQIMRQLDAASASRLEHLVRNALELVKPKVAAPPLDRQRQEWLQELDLLRASVGTGKAGIATEAILDDLRSERC